MLTAIANAVQERLGEDVIFWPRGDAEAPARVYHCKFIWKKRDIWQHIIFFSFPENHPPKIKELLQVTLDVAHELGHLLMDWGPGYMAGRVGISDNDLKDVNEVEADWLAICLLQMYGFILPPE